jgi:uncharacterized protein (DUF433 family)
MWYNQPSQNETSSGWEVAMEWPDRIVVDPEVLVGKPVVKGTRLAVEFIIDLLAQGWPEEDILRNYPGFTKEDTRACLLYVSWLLKRS